MGFGPPGAIGAKLAAPDRTVVCLVATAGLGKTRRCLRRRKNSFDIVWVVMNNNAYGTIAGLESPTSTPSMAPRSRANPANPCRTTRPSPRPRR